MFNHLAYTLSRERACSFAIGFMTLLLPLIRSTDFYASTSFVRNSVGTLSFHEKCFHKHSLTTKFKYSAACSETIVDDDPRVFLVILVRWIHAPRYHVTLDQQAIPHTHCDYVAVTHRRIFRTRIRRSFNFW